MQGADRLEYSFGVERDDGGRAGLRSIMVERTGSDGTAQRFRFDATDGIGRQQIAELVAGRMVHAGGEKWQMVDLNDRDAEGFFLARQISIPGFDVARELQTVPIQRSGQETREDLVRGLLQGRRMPCTIESDGLIRKVEIEAVPLSRSFQLYENGRKIDVANKGQMKIAPKADRLKIAHTQVKGRARKTGR